LFETFPEFFRKLRLNTKRLTKEINEISFSVCGNSKFNSINVGIQKLRANSLPALLEATTSILAASLDSPNDGVRAQFMVKILSLLLSGESTVDDNAVNTVAVNRRASDIRKMKSNV
jgi:hypothetical protein